MVNYNQKYKNEVIVTIYEDDGNIFDSAVTDNKVFYAVGQRTTSSVEKLQAVTKFFIFSVKPDAILNVDSGKVKIYDDNGSLSTIPLNRYGQQDTSYGITLPSAVRFSNSDKNISFDNYNSVEGMTQDISDLFNRENVKTFNLKTTTPSDVTCNYTTGSHSYITSQSVNVTFDGNIKKGDTITIKRNGRNDLTSIIQFDTDFIFSNFGFNNVTNAEISYRHGKTPEQTTEQTTVEFTSSDDGIKWQNPTMVDRGSNFINPVIIQKGYELTKPLAVEFTDKSGKTKTLTYDIKNEIISFDGDNPERNKWNLTVNTGYKKLNIKAGQTKYKTYRLYPTLQNAKIIEPQAIEVEGKEKYYLDPKHTTIKLQANEGYTFESDGSLTYQQGRFDQETLTIKATHTNTATVTLPSDINWSIQQDFMLTMGAVKSEIVETTGGSTNIYKADYTNLLKFSNEVIVKITGSGSGGSGVQTYDVTPYINNLIMLPFDIPTGDKSAIVAGNELFTTQLPTVDNNYLTVDVGKIKVDEQYKNGFDYYQVKTRLMLPYTNMIELDPKHVINQTVSIKYIVNVVNGDTTINLSNDDLFYSTQVNLASEIPFISSANKGSQYTVINQLKTVFRNSIKQAYIIIEQPTPVLNSDFYPTNEKGTLKGYTGNVKASLLNNMDINSNDLNALQNLLETGVKIK